MLRQFSTTLEFRTTGRGLVEITEAVRRWIGSRGVGCGALTLFVRHTSASLLVQENADPEVRADLERFFARLVPDGDPLLRHRAEGPDDMPARRAHCRSAERADRRRPSRARHLARPVSVGAPAETARPADRTASDRRVRLRKTRARE
jgi:secondary thiamine-phosphate synthase enzyme